MTGQKIYMQFSGNMVQSQEVFKCLGDPLPTSSPFDVVLLFSSIAEL